MSTRNKSFLEYALLLAAALVLLFVSVHTLLGVFAFILIPVPFVLMAVKTKGREFFLLLGLFVLLSFMLTGGAGSFIAFLLACIGGVMGFQYQKRRSALAAVLGGAGATFLAIVGGLALIKFALGVNLIVEMQKSAAQLLSGGGAIPAPNWISADDWKKEVEMQLQLFLMVLPAIIVATSFFTSAAIHWISQLVSRLLKRPLPALKPVREWNFPRSLIYYYFGAMLLLLLFGEAMDQGFFPSAINNLKVMLDMVFMIQGLSFCFFLFALKGWKKLSPVLVVSLFIFPLLTYILSLLGILDLGIGLRKRLEKRK